VDGFMCFISIILVSASVTSCYYKYDDKIQSQKPFIVDTATYQCKKTNELVVEK
jgi:hypothetical protein